MRAAAVSVLLLAIASLGCSGTTTHNRHSPGAGGDDTGEERTHGDTPSVPPAPAAPGEGGATGAGGADSASECRCMDAEITWFVDSGLVLAPRSQGHLLPCHQFSYSESTVEGAEPTRCEVNSNTCDSLYTVNALLDGLEHPDMVAALAAAPVVYGSDHRATGGQVDHIDIGGKLIDIGGSCDDDSCPIPQGVADFDYLLGRFTIVQLGACHANR